MLWFCLSCWVVGVSGDDVSGVNGVSRFLGITTMFSLKKTKKKTVKTVILILVQNQYNTMFCKTLIQSYTQCMSSILGFFLFSFFFFKERDLSAVSCVELKMEVQCEGNR